MQASEDGAAGHLTLQTPYKEVGYSTCITRCCTQTSPTTSTLSDVAVEVGSFVVIILCAALSSYLAEKHMYCSNVTFSDNMHI